MGDIGFFAVGSHTLSPTLSRINRLLFTMTSDAWTRQPLTYQQSQLLASRPWSSSFSRDVDVVNDAHPPSRNSGFPKNWSPSSCLEDRQSSRDRFPPTYQEELGASRYRSSHKDESRTFMPWDLLQKTMAILRGTLVFPGAFNLMPASRPRSKTVIRSFAPRLHFFTFEGRYRCWRLSTTENTMFSDHQEAVRGIIREDLVGSQSPSPLSWRSST